MGRRRTTHGQSRPTPPAPSAPGERWQGARDPFKLSRPPGDLVQQGPRAHAVRPQTSPMPVALHSAQPHVHVRCARARGAAARNRPSLLWPDGGRAAFPTRAGAHARACVATSARVHMHATPPRRRHGIRGSCRRTHKRRCGHRSRASGRVHVPGPATPDPSRHPHGRALHVPRPARLRLTPGG